MLRVLFDHQAFSCQPYGGVSRYFYEIISRFKAMEGIQADLVLAYSNNQYLQNTDWCAMKHFLPNLEFKAQTFLMDIFNRRHARRMIKNTSFDLIHPTYFDPYFMDLMGDRPYVVTVYDMIHEIFGPQNGWSDRTSRMKRKVVSGAKKVIAISEHTKRDLMDHFDVSESRISVIHLGFSFGALNSQVENPAKQEKRPYVLFVGRRAAYKNFETFFTSMIPILKSKKDLRLICAGGGPFNGVERARIIQEGLVDQVTYASVAEGSLEYLYAHAECFVFPSLYEGFGLPILEALSAGCPAVLSRSSSLPEVAGEAALYFDPEDAKGMSDAIRSVVDSSSLQASLKKKGVNQLKKFSWEQTVKQTLEVYESVC